MFSLIISIVTAYIVFIILYYVLTVIGKWKVFEKLGEPGWKSLIPFYSDFILYRASWNTTAFFAAVAATVVMVLTASEDASAMVSMVSNLCSVIACITVMMFCIKLSRAFGRGYLFAFGLFFLNPLFMMILGFGQSRYYGNSTCR